MGFHDADLFLADQIRQAVGAQKGFVLVEPDADVLAFGAQALTVLPQALDKGCDVVAGRIRREFELSGQVVEGFGFATEKFDDIGGVAFSPLILPGTVQVRVGLLQSLSGLRHQFRQRSVLCALHPAPFSLPLLVGPQDLCRVVGIDHIDQLYTGCGATRLTDTDLVDAVVFGAKDSPGHRCPPGSALRGNEVEINGLILCR
ncbi:hypothetical protein D3C85_1337240 [compost metagenome]